MSSQKDNEMPTNPSDTPIIEFYRRPRRDPNYSALFYIRKKKPNLAWAAISNVIHQECGGGSIHSRSGPTTLTTPSIHMGNNISGETGEIDLPSIYRTDGSSINESTGKQALRPRHNTIKLADSTEFHLGDGTHISIQDKPCASSTGAEDLDETSLPHDSQKGTFPLNSHNSSPSYTGGTTPSSIEVDNCDAIGDALQGVLKPLSGRDMSLTLVENRDDLSGTVGLPPRPGSEENLGDGTHISIQDKPCDSLTGAEGVDEISLPHDSQKGTFPLNSHNSSPSYTGGTTPSSIEVDNCDAIGDALQGVLEPLSGRDMSLTLVENRDDLSGSAGLPPRPGSEENLGDGTHISIQDKPCDSLTSTEGMDEISLSHDSQKGTFPLNSHNSSPSYTGGTTPSSIEVDNCDATGDALQGVLEPLSGRDMSLTLVENRDDLSGGAGLPPRPGSEENLGDGTHISIQDKPCDSLTSTEGMDEISLPHDSQNGTFPLNSHNSSPSYTGGTTPSSIEVDNCDAIGDALQGVLKPLIGRDMSLTSVENRDDLSGSAGLPPRPGSEENLGDGTHISIQDKPCDSLTSTEGMDEISLPHDSQKGTFPLNSHNSSPSNTGGTTPSSIEVDNCDAIGDALQGVLEPLSGRDMSLTLVENRDDLSGSAGLPPRPGSEENLGDGTHISIQDKPCDSLTSTEGMDEISLPNDSQKGTFPLNSHNSSPSNSGGTTPSSIEVDNCDAIGDALQGVLEPLSGRDMSLTLEENRDDLSGSAGLPPRPGSEENLGDGTHISIQDKPCDSLTSTEGMDEISLPHDSQKGTFPLNSHNSSPSNSGVTTPSSIEVDNCDAIGDALQGVLKPLSGRDMRLTLVENRDDLSGSAGLPPRPGSEENLGDGTHISIQDKPCDSLTSTEGMDEISLSHDSQKGTFPLNSHNSSPSYTGGTTPSSIEVDNCDAIGDALQGVLEPLSGRDMSLTLVENRDDLSGSSGLHPRPGSEENLGDGTHISIQDKPCDSLTGAEGMDEISLPHDSQKGTFPLNSHNSSPSNTGGTTPSSIEVDNCDAIGDALQGVLEPLSGRDMSLTLVENRDDLSGSAGLPPRPGSEENLGDGTHISIQDKPCDSLTGAEGMDEISLPNDSHRGTFPLNSHNSSPSNTGGTTPSSIEVDNCAAIGDALQGVLKPLSGRDMSLTLVENRDDLSGSAGLPPRPGSEENLGDGTHISIQDKPCDSLTGAEGMDEISLPRDNQNGTFDLNGDKLPHFNTGGMTPSLTEIGKSATSDSFAESIEIPRGSSSPESLHTGACCFLSNSSSPHLSTAFETDKLTERRSYPSPNFVDALNTAVSEITSELDDSFSTCHAEFIPTNIRKRKQADVCAKVRPSTHHQEFNARDLVRKSTTHESDFLQTQTRKRKHVQENKEKRRTREKSKPGKKLEQTNEYARLLSENYELKSCLLVRDETIRKLRAVINELRGNIYSLVRVRPPAAEEQVYMSDDGSGIGPFVFHGDGQGLTVNTGQSTGIKTYRFDRVFRAHAQQTDLFEAVSDHVQSALDGCQVCILSYGESGSGKTYTILGDSNDETRGIFPRAMERILTHVETEKLWTFTIKATFVEILNDKVLDLISVNTKGPGKSAKHKTLSIMRDTNMTYVSNATEITFDTNNRKNYLAQLQEIIAAVREARASAHTAKNKSSSRSHAVFRLSISRRQEDIKQSIDGALYICDLAGTEEENFQDARRSRQKRSINQNLHQLRTVLHHLANKERVPSYRESKLTHMLQDCLCVGAKVLMIFNLSPAPESLKQSLYTLEHRLTVGRVQLGKAEKAVKTGT